MMMVILTVFSMIFLPQGSEGCRGALDVMLVTDASTDSNRNTDIFEGARGVWAELPGEVARLSRTSPAPRRYSWWQWAGENIRHEESALMPVLESSSIGWEGEVREQELIEIDYDGGKDPNDALSLVHRDYVDSYIENDGKRDATRCVYVLLWDGRSTSSIATLRETVEDINQDGCAVFIWTEDAEDRPHVETLSQDQASRSVDWPAATSTWGKSAEHFVLDVPELRDMTQAAVTIELARMLNVSAPFSTEFCDESFWDESVRDSLISTETVLFMVLGLGVCTPVVYALLGTLFCGFGADAPSFKLLYFQVLIRFEAWLQRQFGRLGKILVSRPRVFMAVILAVTVVSLGAGGLVYLDPRSDIVLREVADLWAPASSQARSAGEYLGEWFAPGSVVPRVKASMILMDPDNPDANLLTRPYLEDLAAIETQLTDHPEFLERVDENGTTIPTCFVIKDPRKCYYMSPLDYWRDDDGDLEAFEDSEEELWARTFPSPEDQDDGDPLTMPYFRNNVIRGPLRSSQCRFPTDSGPHEIDLNCGGQWGRKDASSAALSRWQAWGNTTDAFRLTFFRIPGGIRSESWDEFFLAYEPPSGSRLQIVESSHGHYIKDDVDRATEEVPPILFVATGGAIIGFIMKVFFRTNLVASRTMLGLTGLIGTLFSIGTGIGALVGFFGMKLSVTTIIVPIVIASIGVDDMFLIMDAFDETVPTDTVADRIPATLQSCGLAILMTTATDALAFLVGTFAPLPAVADMSCMSR